MFETILNAMQYEFMQRALIAGLLVSIACGVIGTYVVIKRVVFISGGIAHTAYGGIGLGYFLGINPTLSAVVFTLLAAFGMGMVERKTRQRADTVIGAMWAIGMAIGVIFIDLTPGYKPDLMSYLFGSILAVPQGDLLMMAILNLVIILMVIIFYKELLAISFDEDFATVVNIPVSWMNMALLGMIALTVVMLMRVVGLIMVIALLTLPAAISARFVRQMKSMMVLSSILGMIFTTLGLFFSFFFNLTSGATIILVAGGAYLLSLLWKNSRLPLFRKDSKLEQ